MAAGRKVLDILLRTKADTSGAEQTGEAIKKAADQGTSGWESLALGVTGVNQALELAGKAAQAFQAAFDFAKLGAEFSQIQQAFDSMTRQAGVSADGLVSELQRASARTVSEMELISSANRALLFDIPAEELSNLMEIARASATATGGAVSDMFDDIVTGIARGSPMILDNLGLTLKIGEATEAYAASLGKSAAELTAAERSQAILNATLEAGEDLINRVGDAAAELTDLERVQQYEAAWQDLKVTFAGILAESLTPMLENMTAFVGQINEAIIKAGQFQEAWAAAISGEATLEQQTTILSQWAENIEDALLTRLEITREELDQVLFQFASQDVEPRRPYSIGLGAPNIYAGLDELARTLISLNAAVADLEMQQAVAARAAEELAEAQRLAAEQAERNRAWAAGETEREVLGREPSGLMSYGGLLGFQASMMETLADTFWSRLQNQSTFTGGRPYASDQSVFGDPVRLGAAVDRSFSPLFDATTQLSVLFPLLGDNVALATQALDDALYATADFGETVTEVGNRVQTAGEQFTEFNGDQGQAGWQWDGSTPFVGLEQMLSPIIAQLGGLTGQLGAFSAVLNPITTILNGYLSVMKPLMQVFAPIAGMFFYIGNLLATLFAPALKIVGVALQALGYVFVFWHNTLRAVINVITGIFWGFAAILTGIANAFIAIHNALRRKEKEIAFINNPLGDKPPGLTEGFINIEDLNAAGTGEGEGYGGGDYTGGNTTVMRAPDLYIYQTFNAPVVGPGGGSEVGRFMAEALIEYANVGGYNIILQEAG